MPEHKPTTTFIDPQHPNVIVIEFATGNTWGEIFAAFDEEKRLAQEMSRPVGIIMDIRHAPDPPDNTTLGRAQQLFRGQPLNIKLWVLCGGSGFSKVVAMIMRNAKMVNMEFAPTLDSAFALIETRLAANAGHGSGSK